MYQGAVAHLLHFDKTLSFYQKGAYASASVLFGFFEAGSRDMSCATTVLSRITYYREHVQMLRTLRGDIMCAKKNLMQVTPDAQEATLKSLLTHYVSFARLEAEIYQSIAEDFGASAEQLDL